MAYYRSPANCRAHIVLMTITFLYCYLNTAFGDSVHNISLVFSAGVFLVYTWHRIAMIVITALIAAGVVAIFPFLAPVAFLLMVVIFFMRIGYIIKHWRAVITGFYMYGVLLFFSLGSLRTIFYIFPNILLRNLLEVIPYRYELLILAILPAFLATLIFHCLMVWLYSNHYTVKNAMPVMGVAPLLIMLLFLPFLKAFDGFDASFDSADTADTATDTVFAGGNQADGIPEPPGYHHTDAYTRVVDGEVQHVRGYIASNPDGIEENNLSYHGNKSIEPYAPAGNINGRAEGISTEAEFEGAYAGSNNREKKNEEKEKNF